MADFGIGEAAAAEGAKTAGEAAMTDAAITSAITDATAGTFADIAGAGAFSDAALTAASGGGIDAAAGGTGGMFTPAGTNLAGDFGTAGELTSTQLPAAVETATSTAAGGLTPMQVMKGGNAINQAKEGNYLPAATMGIGEIVGSGNGINTAGDTAPTGLGSSAVTPPSAPDFTGAADTPASAVAAGAAPGYANLASAAEGGETLSPGATMAPEALKAGADSGGLLSGLKTLGSSLGINNWKDAAPVAGLALNAMSQSQGNKQLGNMQQQLKDATAPLNATTQTLLSNFNSGKLSANDTQAIQDWTQKQKAQVQQFYSSSGLGNSSQMTQAMAQIDQQAQAMHDQALKNYLTEATATTGAVTGPYGQLAQQQIAQDTQLQEAAARLFTSMGQDTANKTTTSTSEPGRP